MKLNNKGFAFSTLLYGILAVIIVVLMVIFALYSKTTDEIYYYASLEEEGLNRCVEQEIALENCYANISDGSSCDRTPYFACLGLSDNFVNGSKESIREYLTKHTSQVGLVKAPSGYELEYVFKGNEANNYINFSNETWRIIGFTSTGLAKIGLFSRNVTKKWDNANSSVWSTSTIYNYLNNEFFTSLSDKNFVYLSSFNVGKVSSGLSGDALYNAEKSEKFSSSVGLLNISDYIKASSNSTCNSGYTSSGKCNSWMTSKSTLLVNTVPSSNNAYVFDSGSSLITTTALTTNYQVVPVVYLNNDVKILTGSGSGTSSDPFVIGR